MIRAAQMLAVFFEPLALDLAVYTTALGGGRGSSSEVAVRYNFGVGVQARL